MAFIDRRLWLVACMVCEGGECPMEIHVAAGCSNRPRQEPYVRCRDAAQRTLSVRSRARLEQLDDAVETALERLNQCLRAQRATLSGAPFIAYHELAADHIDLEVGAPTSEQARGEAEVHVSSLPMGRYLTLTQQGTEPALGDMVRVLERWLARNHESAHGPLYVSVGHDIEPSTGSPVPCVFVEYQITAGEASGAASSRREAAVPEEVMIRAATAITRLVTGLVPAQPQVGSSAPAPSLRMRAREAWLERRGNMHVEDVMSKEVRTCSPSQSLQEAAKLLWDHDIGALPVVDGERRPIGVITDRDICMAAYTQGRRLAEIGVASAMSQRVFVCRRRDLLSAAEHTMAAARVRRLPVVNDEGALAGMLSLNDIVLARTRSPLRGAAERLLGDVVQTLSAISQHRGASQSTSGAPKRAAQTSSRSTMGGTP
jgi:CBS domain-containing protein